MVAIEKGHLRGGLEPDLVTGVGGEEVEAMDGEMEAAVVGELANTGAEGYKAVAAYAGGATNQRLTGVVDAILMEAEAVAGRRWVRTLKRRAFNKVFEIIPSEFEELLEHYCCLFLVQRPHRLCSSLLFSSWVLLSAFSRFCCRPFTP